MPTDITKLGPAKQGNAGKSTGRLNFAAERVIELGLEYERVNGRYEVNAGNSTDFKAATDFLKYEGFRFDKVRKVWHTANERIIARLWPQQSCIKLSRTPVYIYKFEAPARPSYAVVCKELADMPLARGPRCTAPWVIDGKGGARAVLPGEDKVGLQLAAGSRRTPRAFDICLMVTLLALARMHGTSVFVFSGYRQLLRMLGYSAPRNSGAANRKAAALKEALDYLSRLSIKLEHSGAITHLPPLVSKVGKAEHLTVEIDHDFFAFANNSDKPPARLPLPLPELFVAQNLLLMMAASRWRWDTEEGDEDGDPDKSIRKREQTVLLSVWARKTGLNHTRRNRDLRHAFKTVEAVYKARGGEIAFVETGGGHVGILLRQAMRIRPPRTPRDGGEDPPKVVRERLHSEPLCFQALERVVRSKREWEKVKAYNEEGVECLMYRNKQTGEIRDEKPVI